MKTFVLVLAFGLVGSVASAQTAQILWTQSDPLAKAQAETFTLKVDAAAPTALTAACTQIDANNSACSAPIAAPTPGNHTYTLTATNAFGSASTTVGPGSAPGVPGGFKLVITITVTTP